MFYQAKTARRPPKGPRNSVFCPWWPWPWHSNLPKWKTKHVFSVNLAQIRSAVPEAFHTQTKSHRQCQNRTLRSSYKTNVNILLAWAACCTPHTCSYTASLPRLSAPGVLATHRQSLGRLDRLPRRKIPELPSILTSAMKQRQQKSITLYFKWIQCSAMKENDSLNTLSNKQISQKYFNIIGNKQRLKNHAIDNEIFRKLFRHYPTLNWQFNSHFARWTQVSRFPLESSFSTCSRRKPLGTAEWYLWAGCPSCHLSISVKALKRTQSTNPNQWPRLILSSSTAGLLTEEALLPLCRLSNANITQFAD